MTPSLRWALVVGVEALLIVLLLPFGFVFTGTPSLHQFQILVLGIVGVLGWITVVLRPTVLPSLLVVAPLPMLAALTVSALLSPYPSLSWAATWQTAAYAGVFWLLAFQSSRPEGRRNLLAAIGIVVTLAVASFLLEVLNEWRVWLGLGFPLTSLPLRPSNAGGLAIAPTWLADLVALGVPVLVANLWSRGARILAIACAMIALGTIIVTGTRSVLLLVIAASAVAIVIAVRGRASRRTLVAVIFGLVTIGIAGAVGLGSSRSFDEGRSSAYVSAVARITESPLLGTGPGTYGVGRMGDPVDVIGHLAFPDAHNIVLNTAAESGIVGVFGLLATVCLTGMAIRRSWRPASRDRLVTSGALFGTAVFAAHAMVDVVFGLVGIVVIAIAVVAIATTTGVPREPSKTSRALRLRVGLGIPLIVFGLISGAMLRTEGQFSLVGQADQALQSAPADALAIARRVTESTPDLVPAWWVQMVAADAVGDADAAIAAARKIIELEGFGQQWMSLAILAWRQGDTTISLNAITEATTGAPVDPLVELNAMALLEAAGDAPGAQVAARRLLAVQPDIESIMLDDPPAMAAVVAAVRTEVATGRMAGGDVSGAFLVALSGDDRKLADRLLAQAVTVDPTRSGDWLLVVNAWYGNEAARAALSDAARAGPTQDSSLWAWRLAGRACDEAGTALWERAIEIAFNFVPAAPNELMAAPLDQAAALPLRYPTFIWKLDHPQRPYVAGTWTFSLGRPSCVTS